ncbi:MAG TPA: amidohydrolase family protein [Xanthobacteraceae bacterium]|jgi:predicted TIM-barrel fold metal-dependent hydrolase
MSSPRRIDFHFHLIPPFYRDAVYEAGGGPAIGRYPDWSPQMALEMMDQNGIEIALLSLAQPGVQFGDPAKALALARRCNDYASQLRSDWRRRFGALAVVPMWNPQEAVEEIARSLDQLKLEGVCLFASYGERFLGDPVFDPVLEALNDRDAVAFIHPALHPSSRSLALPWPGFVMEYLFDTTRAAVNLVFGGAIERFARIRFVLAHAGGLIPYFAWRLSVSPMIDSRMQQLSRDEVYRRLRCFWYDNALAPAPETHACLNTIAAPDRLVFGSDWPFANVNVVAEAVRTYRGVAMSPAQRSSIDRGNALALFPQFG